MPDPSTATGILVLADGTVIRGRGLGAEGAAVGEVCFNTAMTGYQEIMTDPSYAAQIVTFTFPHIGNVGSNAEDLEAINPHAVGCIVREVPTAASNFRSTSSFDQWLRVNGRIGLAGIDTRALTRRIREQGAPNAVIAHRRDGVFDLGELVALAREWPGLEGTDLARPVSTLQTYHWGEGLWRLGGSTPGASTSLGTNGEGERGAGQGVEGSNVPFVPSEVEGPRAQAPSRKVVAIDYGLKRNILRNLVEAGADVTVVPATASFDDIMAHAPDGLFLSNGPGDPAATGEYAVPVIRRWLDTGKPLFGICLGHQLLGLAVGAKTAKMHQGHRGANHPVKRLSDGRVEITSMNHGFAVDRDTLPGSARETHVSLFDGSNCGFELDGSPAFSVQYHPEASPGPRDSGYLFERFVGAMG